MEMTKEAQEARREYQREWRRTHKDNVRKHNQTYWEKKAREATAAAATSGKDPEELTENQSSGNGYGGLTDDQLIELLERKKASTNFKGV
ncbi:MAG: hypothetical protein IIY70_01550 [Oscillospiraceae bacterium]|nr:hypothetical protein [Oscillospiraceae bacterium]